MKWRREKNQIVPPEQLRLSPGQTKTRIYTGSPYGKLP